MTFKKSIWNGLYMYGKIYVLLQFYIYTDISLSEKHINNLV